VTSRSNSCSVLHPRRRNRREKESPYVRTSPLERKALKSRTAMVRESERTYRLAVNVRAEVILGKVAGGFVSPDVIT